MNCVKYCNIFIGSKLDILVENHKIVYKETRCQPVQDQWPPNQLYTIVNVALIHHKGEQTQQELIDMSMCNVSTVERLSSHHPRVTKRITDIFSSIYKHILIEGAPGIGKTVLVKEIAYCWANGEILTDMKLFLLFIRDPNLHCVSSITELVHYLNDDYLSDSEVEVAVDELRKSKGSGIVLVIDGYDECPSDSKLKDFIDKLVEGKRLPMCMVVITSRPAASLLLRQLVNQRIEILGLAKKEQDQYISESLKKSPEKIIRLQEYLKQQPIINSLTYVPLHLSVLLYLFKENSLPETLTEMNEYFIIHTIYRHLRKQNKFSYMMISKITDLPEPECTVVYQLSKLAYNGLCNSKLVFKYDEIKGVCPKVNEIPGAINGFGLLQSVEFYYSKVVGKSVSLHFMHFTMQEYLAALHVSTLPNEEQSALMTKTFWDGSFRFMWMMYIGIIGSQSISFTYLVNSLGQLSADMITKKCLFLFECYREVKNFNTIPEIVTSMFSDGNIDLSTQTLLPHHIMSLTIFMMRSTTQWKSLNLNCCAIGSNSMSILAKFFVDFKERVVTIKYINLRNNRLTSLWGTHLDQDHTDINSGILQSVEDLDLSLNLLEKSSISECLKINSTLCKLNLSSNKITDEGAKKLAEAIQVNVTLQKLNLCGNEIADEGAKGLGEAIQINMTLQKLNISSNRITDEGAKGLSEAIQVNMSLQEINISSNKITDEGAKKLAEAIQVNVTLQKLNLSGNEIADEGAKGLGEAIQINMTLQKLNISSNRITDEGAKGLSEAIQVNMSLQEINISSNKITDEGAKKLGKAIEVNRILQELNISKNCISKEGVMRIVEACTINRTLHKLVCTYNNLSKSGLAAINEYIRKENAVQIFDASWNSLCSKDDRLAFKTTFELLDVQQKLQSDYVNIKEELWCVDEITDLTYAKEFLQCCLDIQHVTLTGIIMTDDQMSFFCDCLKINSTLFKLNLSGNKIGNKGVKTFSEIIGINTTLQELNISSNKIKDEGAKRLAEAIQVNTTLQELNISSNKITDEGAKRLAEAIQVNKTLQELNISSNKITDEGAKRLAKAIQVNKTLQELNISENWISKEGVMRIVEACTINRTLHKLVCTYNNLSKSGLAAINEYIRKENAVQIFEASWNSLYGNHLAFKTTFELLDVQQKLQSDYGEELWYVDEITDPHVKQLLQFCLDAEWHVNLTVTDDEMSFFCDCLMNNSTLTELNLSISKITDKGEMRLAEAIQVNTTLQELNISKNWISEEGVMRIVEACTINRTLHKLVCTHNNLSKSGLAAINEYIRKENAVQIFEASWNTVIASSRCGPQLVIPTFQSLRRSPDGWENNLLDYDKQVWLVNDTIWEDIPCRFTQDSLTELKLSFSYYSIIPINALVDMILGVMQVITLQKLTISCNEISDDGAIAFSEYLKTNTTLIELDMSLNNITSKGASVIAEAIQVNTALQKLKISYNKISDDGAIAFNECLKTNTTLIELNMSQNNITCKGASVIAEAIQVNTALQKLNISYNKISDDGAIAFSECLKTNTTLIELNMSRNNITCKGASVIAEAIQVNTALQKLNISYNKISDDGAIAFSECLKTNTTLIELDVSENNITHKGASVIAEAIQVNTALQKLNISYNKISDDGAIAFSECLKTNTTLIELDVSGNNITRKGASVIAEAIQVNTALQKLNISYNKIFDDGAIAFSECLKTNTTLIELDMSWNNITCKGASVIAEAIQVNTALQKLNLSCNKISDDGAIAFSECLKTNTTLIELDMSWNNITSKGGGVIAEAIQVNTALQKLNISNNKISDDGAIVFS